MPRRPISRQKSRARSPQPSATATSAHDALADRLHSAAIHLLRRVRKEDVATGQGPARLSALSVLVFGGPRTLGELAAAEQVKPPTMSRIVAALARSSLIRIARDPKDARRMHIYPAPRGTRLLIEARKKRVSSLALQLTHLAPDQLDQLRLGVEILRQVLQNWR